MVALIIVVLANIWGCAYWYRHRRHAVKPEGGPETPVGLLERLVARVRGRQLAVAPLPAHTMRVLKVGVEEEAVEEEAEEEEVLAVEAAAACDEEQGLPQKEEAPSSPEPVAPTPKAKSTKQEQQQPPKGSFASTRRTNFGGGGPPGPVGGASFRGSPMLVPRPSGKGPSPKAGSPSRKGPPSSKSK